MPRWPRPRRTCATRWTRREGGGGGALADVVRPREGPPADALADGLERTEVQRGPISVLGREVVQVLTEIPPGVASGWHSHPGEEVGHMVAGTVEMQVEGRPTLTLRAGEGFLIPPRTLHDALDLGPETGRMLCTYVVEVGEPLATTPGREP